MKLQSLTNTGENRLTHTQTHTRFAEQSRNRRTVFHHDATTGRPLVATQRSIECQVDSHYRLSGAESKLPTSSNQINPHVTTGHNYFHTVLFNQLYIKITMYVSDIYIYIYMNTSIYIYIESTNEHPTIPDPSGSIRPSFTTRGTAASWTWWSW